jgi:hypothetical protein
MMTEVRARWIGWAAAALLGCCAAGWAQVQLGDQLALNLGGSVSGGYSGSLTNQGPSSNGVVFGGNANLSGYYHNSQFLSFDISPFYNQSRNNSNYQSITDSSGVTANTTLFGGSKYPGYVNYSDLYNGEGNFSVPGIGNYRTNGNGQTFGVGWSGNPTGLPSFTVGYQTGINDYSLYGTSGEDHSQYQSVFATSTYSVAGFRLGGGYHYTDGSYTLPEVLTGESFPETQSSSSTYNLSLSHSVALDGNTWVNYSRNTTGYDTMGTNDSQTTDVVTGGIALKPSAKLSGEIGADYDDNLAGTVFQAANAAGAILPITLPQEKSHSWGVYGQTQYTVFDGLNLTGNITHRQQLFLGTAFNSTAYSGGVNYGHDVLGGRFSTSTIVTQNELGNSGGSMLGILSNAIYIRRIRKWNVSASAGYSRNVQTILIAYTTSGYSFTTSASRRIRNLVWNGTASGSKSIVNQYQGANSVSQNYSTGLSHRWLGVSAGYSKSSGLGLFTAQGIAPLPTGVPPTLLPSTVLYGGRTYSAGVGSSPVRGFTFTGSFADARSNTQNGLLSSNNHTQEASAYLQYKFRKVFFTAGYSRLLQGFSASTLPPALVSTYYVGLSRWFNFF